MVRMISQTVFMNTALKPEPIQVGEAFDTEELHARELEALGHARREEAAAPEAGSADDTAAEAAQSDAETEARAETRKRR
jgi:hypothetical protein